MKKLKYKDKFLMEKDGKVTIDGVEYQNILDVPYDVLNDMEMYFLKEGSKALAIAKPWKIVEKIGWGLIYVSAGAAVASWIFDGQASEILKQINLYALAASAPEMVSASTYKIARLGKARKIEKILDTLSAATSGKMFQDLLELTVGIDAYEEGKEIFEDNDGDIIESDDFREIE